MHSSQKNREILSITAKFPNVVQPWLVNQLIQISRNGGGNRILARNAQLDVVSEDVRTHGLLAHCDWVPNSAAALIWDWLASFVRPATAANAWRGLARYPRVLKARSLSLRERMYGLLLCRFFGYSGVSLVHSHSEMAGSKLLPVIAGLGVPFVATFHGLTPDGVPELPTSRRRAYVSMADRILVNTEAAKRQYVALGAPAEKIEIVPQGIPLERFPFRYRSAPTDKNSPLEILSIGRLDPSKGQDYTIRAVRQLNDAGRQVRLHLVGLGPADAEYRKLVTELELADHVEFHGLLVDDALQAVFDRCHVIVLASLGAPDDQWQETQGVVLQEAQASGLLVIATRTGGIPECVDEGRSAFLIEDRSADAIAAAVESIIDQPESWRAWQEAGRAWVAERYSSDQIGRKMTALYDAVIDAARR